MMGSPTIRLAVASVCAVALFAGLASRSRDAATFVALDGPSMDSEKRMCLNKRTLFSTDPYASGHFLKNYVGITLDSTDFVDVTSKNFSSIDGAVASGCGRDKACCMDRATLSSGPSVAYHMIRSNVSLPGHAWVASWVDYWNGLHPVLSNLSAWDPYLFSSTGFWVPDVSAHARLGGDAALRSYSGVDGEPMYAVVRVDAATGRVWEVHGPHVDERLLPEFSPLADDARACEPAFGPARSAKQMLAWWRALNATQETSPGALVAPLLFKVSAPTSDVSAANAYFADAWTSLPWGDVDVATSDACAYLSTEVTIDCESLSTDDAPMVRLSLVEARDDALAYGVAAYEADVASTRAALMGAGTGWSRVLDDHVKFDLPNGWALDAMVATLDATGAEWHAHVQALGMAAEGSIWASGIGSLAIEYGGMFDYATFAPGSLDEYDWCNASSVCGPGDANSIVCN